MKKLFGLLQLIIVIQILSGCNNNDPSLHHIDGGLSDTLPTQKILDTSAVKSIIDMAGEKMIILHEAIQGDYNDFQFWWSNHQPGKVGLSSKFYVVPNNFLKADSLLRWTTTYKMIISDFVFNGITQNIDSFYIAFFTEKNINNGKSVFMRGYRGGELTYQTNVEGKDAVRSRLTLFGMLITKEFSLAFDGVEPDLKLHLMMPAGVLWYKDRQVLKTNARKFARFAYLYLLQNEQKSYSEIILHFPFPHPNQEMIFPFKTTDTLFANIYRRPRFGPQYVIGDTAFIPD